VRLLMLSGGFVGFTIGISFGLAHGSAWPHVIWRASVAALVAGVLLRWWGKVWVSGLHASYRERLNRVPDTKPAKSGLQ
jgi:hypothetical protein